jgi:hypothetical protein
MNSHLGLFTVLVLFGLITNPSATFAADDGEPQYYELRVYSTKSEEQQKMVSEYWEKAAVPAYNRMGVKPIGVFTELADSPTNKIYVLIPFESPGAYANVPAKLAADTVYQTAATDYLNTPRSNAAFVRIESSLLVAFDSMKKLVLPPSSVEKKPWVFELRTYQSHSESKGINKVQMFNSGESQLMREVGLNPVFFGQAIVGPQMPNLVYMISGESRDEHAKHFKAFADSPLWKKLSADAQFRGNVSSSTSVFLKRTPASQI